MISELLNVLEKIPATFWGVVVGSFFSLGGVYLTNRSSDKRLRAQLEHDREIRNRKRDLSLRKEIYLNAADAVATGLIAIGRFADLDIPHNQLTAPYVEKSASITKVHVIAGEKTAKAMAAFSADLSDTFLRLASKRFQLSQQKDSLRALQEQMDTYGKEQNRMIELMKQYNLDGITDKRRWEVVNGNVQFEKERFGEAWKRHDSLAKDLYGKQLAYMKDCVVESSRLSRLLVPVLAAVRAELEMPLNEVAYLEIIEESIKRQEALIGAFLEEAHGFTADQAVAKV